MTDPIREAVQQWLAKAQSDWTTVEILLRSDSCPADSVCFHCQQYVEKLLKAFLTIHGLEAPKTHDLRRLVQLAFPHEPALKDLMDSSDTLTAYGVATRYPDDYRQIDLEEMNKVAGIAKKFAEILLPKLQ